MGTVLWRPDYAKFLIDCAPEEWQSYVHALHGASHKMKCSGDWLKSHKVNRLWYNANVNRETWSIDIWGEWAGIVEYLPEHWFMKIRRFDIRSVLWDVDSYTIQQMGLHLALNITSHNIYCYNTRPATKRLGRDRGGHGFAIGSHKSDLRITCYKRTGEPAALEYQMTGAYLSRLRHQVWDEVSGANGTRSLWLALRQAVEHAGTQRLDRICQRAEVGKYWAVIGPEAIPELPPIQAGFLGELPDEEHYPDQSEPTSAA